MNKLRRWLSRRSRKSLIAIAVVVAGIALLAGGGVYAALGGTILQSTSSSIDLQKGLVAYWKFDGNAKDASPYRNNGTVSGPTLTTDRKGKANSAYAFAGGSNNIQAPGTGNLDITGDLSISVWVKPTTLSGFSTGHEDIIGKRTLFGGGDEPYSVRIRNTGVVVASWKVTTGGDVNGYKSVETATGVITANTVYHIVLTRDSSQTCLFINGISSVCASMAGVSTASGNSNPVNIGGTTSQFSAFTGTMDDLRMYNRAINASEAKVLYDQYDPGLQAANGDKGLLAQWKLDGNAKDSSPNRIHGTVSGATLAADRKGRANSAYNFDGTSANITMPLASAVNQTSGSIGLWFNATASPSGKMLFSCGVAGIDGSTAFSGLFFILNGGSLKAGWTSSSSSDADFGQADSPISLNTWYHAVVTWDTTGNFVRLYVNGVQQTTEDIFSNNGKAGWLSNCNIGSAHGTRFFNGKIDDVRVYDRALSATEVAAQYNTYDSQINLNSSPTNTTAIGNINQGLVGYWPFSGNAKDSTPYRSNGTITGATLSADRRSISNNAYNFATTNNISIPNGSLYNLPEYSISAWVNSTTTGGGSMVNKNQQFFMRVSGTPRSIQLGVSCNGTSIAVQPTFTSFPIPNGWDHVVMTVSSSGNILKFYLNGVFEASNALGCTISGFNTNPISLGNSGALSDPLNNALDDVRIYNRALNATEVQSLYTSQN